MAYRLINDSNKDEYFILENRAQQGWDAYIPTEGLMIYHVDYDETAWYENSVNNYNPNEWPSLPLTTAEQTTPRRRPVPLPYKQFIHRYIIAILKAKQWRAVAKTGHRNCPQSGHWHSHMPFHARRAAELDPPSFTDENLPDNSDMQPYPEGFTAVWRLHRPTRK